MPYCKSALQNKAMSSVQEVLSAFVREQCNANQAHPINARHFNFDGGLNDLRAIRQDNESVYGFFCRYKPDLNRTEGKVQAFAQNHDIECQMLDIEDIRKQRYSELNYD